MNNFFLDDPEVLMAIPRIWLYHSNLGFTGKLRRVVKF